MNTPVKLTPAQRRGLEVLVKADAVDRKARVSNQTGHGSGDFAVYWQVADALADAGLALKTNYQTRLQLTDKGRQTAREVGISRAPTTARRHTPSPPGSRSSARTTQCAA